MYIYIFFPHLSQTNISNQYAIECFSIADAWKKEQRQQLTCPVRPIKSIRTCQDFNCDCTKLFFTHLHMRVPLFPTPSSTIVYV